MTATPKQRTGLTMASLVVGHSVMAINHQGFIGAILATAAGMAAWAYADEVFDKLKTGEPSAPPTGGTRATHGVMRRLLTTRQQRRANGLQADVRDEEEQEAYQQTEAGANGTEVDEDGDWTQETSTSAKSLREQVANHGIGSRVSSTDYPTFVRYEEIAAQVPRGHILVGIGKGGHVMTREAAVGACTWIVGLSGTGKTSTTVLRVEERSRAGHRFLGVDPHSFKPDSLTNAVATYEEQFLMPMARTPEETKAVLSAFLDEFYARKAGEVAQPWQPITLLVMK